MPLNDKQQAQFDIICARISDGMSLRAACSLDGSPSKQAVNKWLNADETGEVVAQYARAKEQQAEAHIDEMMEIADNEEDVQRARLKIDTIKWTASKLKPKKYGDKINHDHGGKVQIVYSEEDAKA